MPMLPFKPVILWTDAVMWLLVLALAWYVRHVRRDDALRATWQRVFTSPAAMSSGVLLGVMLLLTMVDSLHFRKALPPATGAGMQAAAEQAQAWDTKTLSLLDVALQPLVNHRENSYSSPLATHGFVKETVPPLPGAQVQRDAEGNPMLPKRAFPRLKHGGAHLSDPSDQWAGDVLWRGAAGAVAGALGAAVLARLLSWCFPRRRQPAGAQGRSASHLLAWRSAWRTWLIVGGLTGLCISWSMADHVLGTDRTGNDVLYIALKSIRTAFVIGSLATLATLPLALLLGLMAGYFKGWVDDVIQYIYTVLSSVPNILLIAACVLMMQVYLDKHPELFETGLERADIKIFMLCIILGVTGWAGLCRLLRAETLKLRELEYVQAAQAFGASPWRILRSHILPNVMHLVLITTVLEFSSLILYEAVLSYVGVGVDPSMHSFGGLINQARLEMSRDPVVWWSFAAAFGFMVTLVLAANLLADAVRDAFDPRAQVQRPRKQPLKVGRQPARRPPNAAT